MKQTKILDRQFIPAGQIIMHQGASGQQAFIIESGLLEVYQQDKKGDTTIIGEAGPGELIGEMAIMNGQDRNASVRALRDSIIVAIPPEELDKAIQNKAALYKKITKIVDTRTKQTQEMYT